MCTRGVAKVVFRSHTKGPMVHLTLSSLILALDDLLTKRLSALESFAAGKAAVPFLTVRREKIAALPAELKGAPLAEELGAADLRHDGFGAVVWFGTEAVLRHPDATAEMITAAQKVRKAFIPTMEALRVRYDIEAQSAKDNEAFLVTLEDELKMFQVPTGGTLFDAAKGFVEEGKKLDVLLSSRADAKSRREATVLRIAVISKLNRLRQDLADALKDDASLPADLEGQVFGYFDMLEKKDADSAEAKKAKKKSDAPAMEAVAIPADPPPVAVTP